MMNNSELNVLSNKIMQLPGMNTEQNSFAVVEQFYGREVSITFDSELREVEDSDSNVFYQFLINSGIEFARTDTHIFFANEKDLIRIFGLS